MIDLNALNPEQRKAVEATEGPLLVLAGAGSGKTRVLTYRVAKLIEMGVPAWKILAITFTNKAAREMLSRVEALVGAASEGAWISTFHSCCCRILRRDIEKLGYKRSFVIYDDDDKLSAIKRVCKDMKLDEKEFPPRAIKVMISDAKNRMLTPSEWLKDAGDDHRNKLYSEAYSRYESMLVSNNALDFDDLIIKTLLLFGNNEPVLSYYQQRFDYVLVDEYQDTNIAQYELVRLLAGGKRNLCVVGDDDQSIYGWRGADIRNILEFEKDFPDCKVVKLEQNYRSTANILDAANQVIAHNEGRKEKALWTESSEGDKLTLYNALDERDEASYVAAMSKKIGAGTIAVLYRTNAQSRVLEDAFFRGGMKYRVYGGLRFYDRKEVKDIIAYMRVLVNPDDDISARRIINEPKRGIGDSTIEQLAAHAEANGLSFLSAALDYENAGLSGRANLALNKFSDIMLDLNEALYDKSPSEFVELVLQKSGYIEMLEAVKNDENRNRLENIRELQGAVSEFERLNPEGTTQDFLENVALVTDLDSMDEHNVPVALMTMHAAKGLEFDTVFITGMEEGIFPITRAIFEDEQLEEERRLCYVGMTRARKQLFLTHARTRMLFNVRRADELSRFVTEIPRRLLFDHQARGATRLPPARPTQSIQMPKRSNALGIPGLSKGFAPPSAPATVYAVGDTIAHSRFGIGSILEVTGAGDAQRIKIRFTDGTEKIFSAHVAPIIKVKRPEA